MTQVGLFRSTDPSIFRELAGQTMPVQGHARFTNGLQFGTLVDINPSH